MENILDYGLVVHGKEKPDRLTIVKENLGLILHGIFMAVVGLAIIAGFSVVAWFVLQICFSKSVAAADDRAATLRWIYYVLTILAIPTVMMMALPALPRFGTNFLARMGCGMRLRLASDQEAIVKVLTPKLTPGERILAHFYNDEIMGGRPWVTSIYFVVMMSVAFLAHVSASLIWSIAEPFYMVYLSSAASILLVLAVWFTEILAGLDKGSAFLLHALLIVQLAYSRVFLSNVPFVGMGLTILLGLEILIGLMKLRSLSGNSFIVLTNKGLWRLGSRAMIFPLPRLLPNEPMEFIAATDIRIGQAAMGEKWTVLKESGKPVVLHPMFVTAKSLTACAKEADYLLSARSDEEEMSLGFTLPSFFCFGLWALLVVFLAVLPMHYTYTYFEHPLVKETEKDEGQKKEYLAALRVICKHHPLAIDPRMQLARRLMKDNSYGEAQPLIDEMKKILRYIPETVKSNNRQCFWATYTICELAFRKGIRGKDPKGWEPKTQNALLAYRKALLYLFSTEDKHKNSRPGETLRLLNKAITLEPKAPGPRFMKAFTCWDYSYIYLPPSKLPTFDTVLKKATKRVKEGQNALKPLLKDKEWKAAAEIVSQAPVVLPDEVMFWILFEEFLSGKIESKEKVFKLLKERDEGVFLHLYDFIIMAAEPPNSEAEVLKLVQSPTSSFKRPDWKALKRLPDGNLMSWFRINFKKCNYRVPNHLFVNAKGDEKLKWLMK